jgi:hypothetical protein
MSSWPFAEFEFRFAELIYPSCAAVVNFPTAGIGFEFKRRLNPPPARCMIRVLALLLRLAEEL